MNYIHSELSQVVSAANINGANKENACTKYWINRMDFALNIFIFFIVAIYQF